MIASDNSKPQSLLLGEMIRLRETLGKHNQKVTNLNSFTLFAVGDTYLPSWIEPEKERREIRIQHTLKCLKTADALGCKNISVPPGGPLGGMSRKAGMALFYQDLARVIPPAEDLGVKILVEPEPAGRESLDFLKPLFEEAGLRINGI